MIEHKIIPDRFLGNDELAKALGIAKNTLWNMRKRNELPHIRVGKKIYYDPVEVKKALGIND